MQNVAKLVTDEVGIWTPFDMISKPLPLTKGRHSLDMRGRTWIPYEFVKWMAKVGSAIKRANSGAQVENRWRRDQVNREEMESKIYLGGDSCYSLEMRDLFCSV